MLSVTGRRWNIHRNIADDARTGDASTPHAPSPEPLSPEPLVAQVLKARAVDIDSNAWLHPSLEHLHDPYTMRGMATAVERIRAAVREKQRVRIVTDYDVDGTTSSLILQGTLRLLGGGERLDYHIPNRMGEGYGFSLSAADQAVSDQIDLVITADIGVRDHAAVQRASQGGVDVIVCDHHLPAGQSVPDAALAVLCPPQAECHYENPALAACGVSLKLAQALLSTHPRREPILRSMLKIAAIGTVADVVDLSTLENRAIVALGLRELRRGPHSPGLAALMGVSGIGYDLTQGWHIDASDLGYRLGPRINAAGRLDSATAVIKLFDERDPRQARERARQLDALNTQRKGIQRRLVQGALAQVGSTPPPFLVLWGPEAEGWHRGVVGIVAAKLREEIHRPVAVVAVSGDQARGSVRSIPEIHAVHALDSAADLLDQYGGHPVAAGFSLAADKLPALAERLAAWAEKQLGVDHPAPALDIDARTIPEQLTWPVVEALLGLGPFGKGNPPPLLAVPCTPTGLHPFGQGHLGFRAGPIDAVWWGGAQHRDALRGPVELAVEPGINRYNGRTARRLTVRDVRAG